MIALKHIEKGIPICNHLEAYTPSLSFIIKRVACSFKLICKEVFFYNNNISVYVEAEGENNIILLLLPLSYWCLYLPKPLIKEVLPLLSISSQHKNKTMSSVPNPELPNQEAVVNVNEFVSVENPDSKRSKFGSFFKNPYPPGFSRKVPFIKLIKTLFFSFLFFSLFLDKSVFLKKVVVDLRIIQFNACLGVVKSLRNKSFITQKSIQYFILHV